jgi:ubiquinone/menaquinone biosynthesis C-methylase UbiE
VETNTEKIQREYYNRIAQSYHATYGDSISIRYRKRIYKRLFDVVNFQGAVILDGMCGGGQNTHIFKSYGASPVGVDISEEQCATFRLNHPSTPIYCTSILTLPFANSSFDLIYIDSLHHTHPHMNACLDELMRVLKPGGKVIFWEPNYDSFFDYLRRFWYKFDPKYFCANEQSISFSALNSYLSSSATCSLVSFGGSLGYLAVFATMALRSSRFFARLISPLLIAVDQVIEPLLSSHTSLWFIAVFERKF